MSKGAPEAFIRSIAGLFTIAEGSRWHGAGPLSSLTHREPLEHPWPRAFEYRTEVFSIGGPASSPQEVRSTLRMGRGDFVLTVFGNAGELTRSAWEDAGFVFAWSNELMTVGIEPLERVLPERVELSVIQAEDLEDANALNGDRSFSSPSLDDDRIHNRIARVEGEAVGTAQMVTVDPDFAYVSDMYVVPEQRGTGIGRTLLDDLHITAARLGRSTSMLVPSRMARQIGFYERAGYAAVAGLHLFIPPGADASR